MANVLLFNLENADKRSKLRFILFKLGIRAREVLPEEFGQPLGYLAGLEDFTAAETPEEGDFSAEMLVMNGFSEAQLDAFLQLMRQERVSIPRKAVITAHNASWSSLHLYQELSQEMEAMKAARLKDAARKSAHGNSK